MGKVPQFVFAFVKRVYAFLILFASDPFDVSERWFGMSYNPPFWLFWILLSLAIVFALIMAIRDVKKQTIKQEVNLLGDIKSDLITLNKYEKEVATKKGKKRISSAKIKYNFENYITNTAIPLFTNISTLPSKEQLLDSIIKFFVGVGDILDSNGYGLKEDLAIITEYNSAKEDIAIKQLRLRKKNRVLIQEHIRKAMLLNYGLNSVIVFRNIYRSSPEFRENIPLNYNTMIESAERVGDTFLPGV